MKNADDAKLCQDAAAGDETAIAECLRRIRTVVRYICPADPEKENSSQADVESETVENFWRYGARSFDPQKASLDTYISTIARHVAAKISNKRAREKATPIEWGNHASGTAWPLDIGEQLAGCKNGIILQRFMDADCNFKTLAAAMGVSEATARQRIARARK